MKKLFTIALAAFMITHAQAQIQRPADPTQKVQSDKGKKYNNLEDIYDELDLTAAQKAQVKVQIEQMKKDKQALDNDNTLTMEQKRARVADLKKKYRGQLENILTAEQKEKAKKIRLDNATKKKIRTKLYGDQPKGNNGVKMGQYYKELDLNDAQKKQVNQMRQDHKKQLDAINRDNSLTEAQKTAKRKTLRQDEITRLKTILTPEQQVKAKKMLEDYKDHNGKKGPKGSKGNKGAKNKTRS